MLKFESDQKDLEYILEHLDEVVQREYQISDRYYLDMLEVKEFINLRKLTPEMNLIFIPLKFMFR